MDRARSGSPAARLRLTAGRRPSTLAAAGGPSLTAWRREQRLVWVALALMAAVALAVSATRFHANPILGAMAGGLVVIAWQRYLLAWPTLLGAVILVILFIPIRRFTIGGALPLEIEPYRVLIGMVLVAWLLAVLVEPHTRWRRTGLEVPVIGFAVLVLLSLAANVDRIGTLGLGTEVLKQVTFFASFVLVMYFVTGVLTGRREIDGIVILMVAGGTLVALLTIVEWRTGWNAFAHIRIPGLAVDPSSTEPPPVRGFRARAYASAQHPIALGAALVLLTPLAIYLYRRFRQPAWLVCGAVLVLGALATGSRTAAAMLAVELLVFVWLKRKETVRLLPLVIPLVIACQIVMPGTLGTFKAVLFPEQGLIAEQSGGGETGSGRIADLGPSLEEFARTPLFGQGFGTRLTSDQDSLVNARILDNEWLGMLLEVGALGTLCLLWLYVRSIRMLGARVREEAGPHGWLLTAIAAGTAAFAMGMLTYDAFSFIQVTFLSFILLGLGAAALRVGVRG